MHYLEARHWISFWHWDEAIDFGAVAGSGHAAWTAGLGSWLAGLTVTCRWGIGPEPGPSSLPSGCSCSQQEALTWRNWSGCCLSCGYLVEHEPRMPSWLRVAEEIDGTVRGYNQEQLRLTVFLRHSFQACGFLLRFRMRNKWVLRLERVCTENIFSLNFVYVRFG